MKKLPIYPQQVFMDSLNPEIITTTKVHMSRL